ncbi:MAG: biotin/lipoyl-containing protein [Anaerolineaceae bacterium]|jgi:biotin carboxyl carrier protein
MIIKVEIDGQTYAVVIQDIHARPIIAEVDGQTLRVWPEEENGPASTVPGAAIQTVPVRQTLIKKNQPPAASSSLDLTAPLPGVIITIDVKPGDTVKTGQTLCTLEAMKMKNAIRSNRDGVIAQVHIATGDQVKHNQPLFTFQA